MITTTEGGGGDPAFRKKPVGDRLDDSYIPGDRPLRICNNIKKILGLVGCVGAILLVLAILYLYDPEEYTYICLPFRSFCDLLARGCDGITGSGKEYDACGECGGSNTTC
jgi:hypothetical protein